jgi:hypothetical protein
VQLLEDQEQKIALYE